MSILMGHQRADRVEPFGKRTHPFRFWVSGLLFMVLVFMSCSEGKRTKRPMDSGKPNILFIAIDDLNDWVGCLEGHPQVKTPNIDRLAQKGTLFTNAHAQSPICNPSRTSILTGYRPSSTGIYGLSPWIREVPELSEIITLPQYFANNGYRTYSTGKIFHGGYGRRDTDTEFDSLGPPAGVLKRPPTKLSGNTPGGNHPLMDWGRFPLKAEETADYQIASWAVDRLQTMGEAPFFLSVGFFLPHVPLFSPEPYFDRYPRDGVRFPEIREHDRDDTPRASWYNHWDVPEPRWKWMRENDQDTVFIQSYLAAISFVDSQVGRVLKALEESRYAENTLIVLWSDHGFHLGEKEITGKNTLWEESTRVPLVFAGNGLRKAQHVDAPVELLDIYPTLIDLCDLPAKTDLEGHSLVPLLENPEGRRGWPAITTNNYRNHAVRTDRWRYIRYADGSEELYDHANDPNEWHNLAGQSRYDRQIDSLRKWLPETNKLPYPGNYQRILEYRDGEIFWQREKIEPDDPIPGL